MSPPPEAPTADTLGAPPVAARPAPRADGEPLRIGRYEVVDELGQGGMGVVYVAHDPELDRKVAIKLIFGEGDPKRLRRRQDMLLREAQALARLAHPNIVAIYDVGLHRGQVFVAMEFVAGRTMRQWWIERRPGWREVLAAMLQAGQGLVAAHAAGLVHRDVKPDNLLIGDDGRVRVADFGIARIDATLAASTWSSGSLEPTTISRTNLLGTPMYMPPEQQEGGDVGPHSDLFGFCVTLWEGLYGRLPFVGRTDELPALVRAGPPEPPPSAPDLPPWLVQALRRGLSARPESRWPSMQALLAVLAQDPDARRTRWRRRATLAALTVLGGVALVLGGRALQASWARSAAERAAAEKLVGVSASVERMLARGMRSEAEDTLRAFVQEPALRDTQAAIDAWLMWAARMDALGEPAAAQAAFVEAHMALPEADPREPTIALQLARHFRAQWRYHELAALAVQVAQRWPELARTAPWIDLRTDAALARGDLVDAAAALAEGPAAPEREDLAPLLRALSTARCPVRGDMSAHLTDPPGDDRPEILLVDRAQLHGRISAHRMDAALTPTGRELGGVTLATSFAHVRPLVPAPGGPAYVIGYTHDQPHWISLHELGEGGPPREVLRWADDSPESAAVVDLDGDGAQELYLGTGTYTRKLHRLDRDADGRWQRRPAHPPTDAMASDINSLAPGDFDGDGRLELAAAVGAWRAYDVRIFEADERGELRVAVRQRFGHVRRLVALRGADGSTLLALARDDTARNKVAWAPGEPQGEPAGLHVVRRSGDALVPVAHVPWPALDTWDQEPHAYNLLVGDFDGDGLDDIAAELGPISPFAQGMLLRQRPDGSFVSAPLGAIRPLLAGNFDDDPADELLARIKRGESAELCVLGVDGDPVAPVGPAAASTPTPALSDPLLARAYARADNLAGLGLQGDAARALESRITLATNPADRRALQRRIAELHEAAGEFALAGERFEVLAREGDIDAALRATADFEQVLRTDDVLRVAQAALRSEGLTAVQVAELRAARDRAAAIAQRVAQVDLRFEGPLKPGWQVLDPTALRLDSVRGELVVDVAADTATIARLPIDLTGEPLTIEFDLDVERADWGSSLGIVVRPLDSDDPVAMLKVSAGGGGGYLHRNDVFGPWHVLGQWETEHTDEPSRHRMRATLLPDRGRTHVEELGDHPGRGTLTTWGELRPGPHLLELHSVGFDDFKTQHIRARIRRISLLGARVARTPPSTDLELRLASELASGRWLAALALADAAHDPSPTLALGRAMALAELGRGDEASAELARLDPAAPALRRRLVHLLRTRRETYAPLLRAAHGPAFGRLLLESLATVTDYPDRELRSRRLAATADLEGLDLPDSERDTHAELLKLRGVARMEIGALDEADADLRAAAALKEAGLAARGESRDAGLATLELRRAEVAARRARVDEALAASARAMLRATDPEWMSERLRISVDLQPVRADPRWLEVHPLR